MVDLNPSLVPREILLWQQPAQPYKFQSILSCDYLGTRQTDLLDNVVDGDVEQPVIKGLHLHSAAGKGLEARG